MFPETPETEAERLMTTCNTSAQYKAYLNFVKVSLEFFLSCEYFHPQMFSKWSTFTFFNANALFSVCFLIAWIKMSQSAELRRQPY